MSISAGDAGFAAESAATRAGMPDPDSSIHLASLDYYCTISQLTAVSGNAGFAVPDPVRFSFAFETGSSPVPGNPGVLQVTWDFSWFNQTTTESEIAFALSQIVAAVAQMLGLTIDTVNQAVLVRRIWTFAPNLQGAGTGTGRVVTTDIMQYPPHAADDHTNTFEGWQIAVAVSAADAAQARDGAFGFGGDWSVAVESGSVS